VGYSLQEMVMTAIYLLCLVWLSGCFAEYHFAAVDPERGTTCSQFEGLYYYDGRTLLVCVCYVRIANV